MTQVLLALILSLANAGQDRCGAEIGQAVATYLEILKRVAPQFAQDDSEERRAFLQRAFLTPPDGSLEMIREDLKQIEALKTKITIKVNERQASRQSDDFSYEKLINALYNKQQEAVAHVRGAFPAAKEKFISSFCKSQKPNGDERRRKDLFFECEPYYLLGRADRPGRIELCKKGAEVQIQAKRSFQLHLCSELYLADGALAARNNFRMRSGLHENETESSPEAVVTSIRQLGWAPNTCQAGHLKKTIEEILSAKIGAKTK